MTIDFDDDAGTAGEEAEVEEAPRRSPLRTILLLLLVLVLACVVCFVGVRTFGSRLPINIPGISPGQGAPTVALATETPAPPPTSVVEVPPAETTEPLPATEEPTPAAPTPVEAAPTTEGEVPPTVEPTEEAAPAPTEEPVQEHAEEPVELTPAATTAPVPGPTSTPGPTVVITVESCDNNNPPTAEANGPYMAMMGKGQAFVTFDGSGSIDADGTIVTYEWDFGDGSAPQTGQSLTYGYTAIGSYVATLTVTDNCGATGQDTADVTIVGPTPPASGTATPNSTPTPDATPPAPVSGTLGFCYLVQYGDTLSGIAWRFGIPLPALADVNGVSMEYFVIAGQGLFIPTGEISSGPNVYQVEPGDTLNSIAYQCDLTIQSLATANNLDTNAQLSPGQNLIIPLWRQVNP